MNTLKTGRPSRKEKIIASVQKVDEATIRMNVNIPKEFHKKIKQKALDEDITITELVMKAIKEYLSK
jgi:predicted HicB family RNase H-like nuclease